MERAYNFLKAAIVLLPDFIMPDFSLFYLLVIPLALLLDHVLGEPAKFHPLVGFGHFVAWVEERLYGSADLTDMARMLRGGIALLGVLALVVAPCWLLRGDDPFSLLGSLVLLYLTLGGRSLGEHAQAVATALDQGDLPAARLAVAGLVSRDTAELDATGIARAATESVLENGCDAVFAALFWFVLLGAPGAVLYRGSNTLDAMWGYRTPHYNHFGRPAARLDDLLNYLPARLTVFTYALLGRTGAALRAWWWQGSLWYSPNAGPVMAAGAGALGVRLGGPAQYHGQVKDRPDLGEGNPPTAADIRRALALVQKGSWLWAVLIALIALIIGGVAHA